MQKPIKIYLSLALLLLPLAANSSILVAQELKAESLTEVQRGLDSFDTINKEISQDNKNVYSIELENQLDESIKVEFENKTYYFRPYEKRIVGSFEKGIYEAKVYSVSGKYLGKVKKYVKRKGSTLSINSFVLSLYEEEKTKNKDTRDLKSQIFIHKEFTAPDDKYNFVRAQALSRKLKVANDTLGDIHIDVSKDGEELIGKGWTIKKGLSIPEELLYKGRPVLINPNAELFVDLPASKIRIEKKATDLSIDSEGNFIWIIK